MIYKDKFKSFSLLTDEDFQNELEEDLSKMTEQELDALFLALSDVEYEKEIFGLELESPIVPIEDWIENEYYVGDFCRSLYDPWKEDLIELFTCSRYDTGVFVGGIGSGKSTVSQLALLWMVYEVSCYRDPARSFGLAPGSTVDFCSLAKSAAVARRIVFDNVVAKMREIPYFSHDFTPLSDNKNEILFPKRIRFIAGSSADSSVIGANIYGGIMDEGNFWTQKGKKSSHTKDDKVASKRWGDSIKVGKMYDSIIRRMKSRFLKHGRVPGVLLVVSSKTSQNSFTENLIKASGPSGSIFARDRSIIDVKRDSFTDDVFKVLVGNENWPSKVLCSGEDEMDFGEDAVIVEIPEEFRPDFEDNVDESLRDIAGVSTISVSPFISRTNLINEMFDADAPTPFRCSVMYDPMLWDSRLRYTINWQAITTQLENGDSAPKVNPEARRHVHFDPALTGDRFGVCIGHISGLVPVERIGQSEHEVEEYQPHFHIDLILGIEGEKGEEVLFKNVRQLCYEFSHKGFYLAQFTSDTYQSREMLQALRGQGYRAGIYSVDTGQSTRPSADSAQTHEDNQMEMSGESRRKQAYRYLRSCIYEKRISCYNYPLLATELKGLVERAEMVDHTSDGSKDLADALAGCVWTLFKSYTDGELIPPIRGESEVRSYRAVDIDSGEHESDEEYTAQEAEAISAGPATSAIQPPRKYFKKNTSKKATIEPSYKKVSKDGEEESIDGSAFDLGFVRG